MNISVIASGSNGNSTFIEHKNSSILIDAGKSGKEIQKRLSLMGKSLDNLNGIVLTHAHNDHYASVGVLARRFKVPLYLTKETYKGCSSRIGSTNNKFFSNGKDFKIGDINLSPIRTSHDVPSSGFVLNKKFGLFTDSGVITKEIMASMKNVKGLLLESNYDYDMLLNGSYPYYLKQRIASNLGHLSNIHASSFIQEFGKNLDFVLLGHLSANNNNPALVKKTFETIVKRKTNFSVLSRDKHSGTWEL